MAGAVEKSKMNNPKKTKIVCTIGPATDSEEKLTELIKVGMNVMRLNFSHGDLAEHQIRIDRIRKIKQKIGIPIAILQDLSGPKIRIGEFKTETIILKKGAKFILTTDKIIGNDERVSVNYPKFAKEVKVGNLILIQDGKKSLEIVAIKENEVICKVIVGGELGGKRGVNLPGSDLSISSITEKDKKDIQFGLKNKIDLAFIAMHGEYGEDGQIQSLLETFNIPYTGSGPLTSALAMNKGRSSILFADNKFNVPKSLMLQKKDPHIEFATAENFRCPIVIKPANRGSSIGISIAQKKADIKYAIQKALRHSDQIIAQQHIKGREVTCGVLEINQAPIALLPTEIIPNSSNFFDYYSKYNSKGSTEITPPDLPEKVIRQIQSAALSAHKILGCSGISRTDMILNKGGKVYILETNTLPGLTKTSLLPQQAQKMGIEFPKLLEIIIKNALDKHKNIYG